MRLTELFVGLFLIGFGILINFFPNLIAGFNTLSKEDKKKVDSKHLTQLVRNAFIVFGVFVIIAYYTLSYAGIPEVAKIIIPVSTPVFVIVLILLTLKYNIKK